MKPQSAKSKGRLLCKAAKDLILTWYPEAHTDDIKVTSSGAGGEDLQFSPAMRSLLPISLECKSYARIAALRWFDQAKANCKGHTPVVVMKENRGEMMAMLRLEDLLKLVGRKRDH